MRDGTGYRCDGSRPIGSGKRSTGGGSRCPDDGSMHIGDVSRYRYEPVGDNRVILFRELPAFRLFLL